MKKVLLTVASLLVSMMLSTHLFAEDGRHEWGRGRGMPYPAGQHERAGEYGLFAKLDLTGEQKAKIEALRLAHLQEVKPLQDQMFSRRGDMKLLWLQPVPDKEKILSVQREMRQIKGQLEDKATAHRVDLFNVLTPEQKEKVKAFLSAHHFGPPGRDGMGMKDHGSGMMFPGGGMMGR